VNSALPQVCGREHQRVVAPPFLANDPDSLDGVAVVDVEGQVVPVVLRRPALEVIEDEEQPDRSEPLHLVHELSLALLELAVLQHAPDVESKNVRAFVLHGDRHGLSCYRPRGRQQQ